MMTTLRLTACLTAALVAAADGRAADPKTYKGNGITLQHPVDGWRLTASKEAPANVELVGPNGQFMLIQFLMKGEPPEKLSGRAVEALKKEYKVAGNIEVVKRDILGKTRDGKRLKAELKDEKQLQQEIFVFEAGKLDKVVMLQFVYVLGDKDAIKELLKILESIKPAS